MKAARNVDWLRGSLVTIVFLHLGAVAWHTAAHSRIPVPLTDLQTLFVATVILTLPLFGTGLLWAGRAATAAPVIAFSMIASLAFGFLYHFVVSSPDHVLAVPEHASRPAFIVSAALLAITEAAGAVVALFAARAWR